MKSFIQYLVLTRNGRIGKHVRNDLHTFFATWRHLSGKSIPTDDRHQVNAYIGSEELRKLAPLTTANRTKAPAHIHDVKVIPAAILHDRQTSRTNRQCMAILSLLIVSATTAERPGALVESSAYLNSNQSLKWCNVQFIVIPNEADPNRPTIVARLKLDLLKAY